MEPLLACHRKVSLCGFHPYKYHKLGSSWSDVPVDLWAQQMPPVCEGHLGLCGPKGWTGHHPRLMVFIVLFI